MTLLLALPVLVLGLAMVGVPASNASVSSVYAGFVGALAVWGWIELAFLSGVVTGPERRACPPGLTGWPRFVRAWWTVAWHEMSLLAGLLAVAWLSLGALNDVAFWSYLILFTARIMAKLNIFFGVPRINTEFVPRPLAHLTSYFRQGRITPMFPLAITFLSFALAGLVIALSHAVTPQDMVKMALLSALAGLALVEHWLMVVPLPDAKLWRWMLPAPPKMTSKESKTHGL